MPAFARCPECGRRFRLPSSAPTAISCPYCERAKKRLAQLKEKPLGRVGVITITGIKQFSDGDILGQIELYPGQILTQADLRAAEQSLSRLKGLKSDPKVAVIDREDGSEFKDIEIAVEEK